MLNSMMDFIELAEDHYWDTFEPDRAIILKHIYAIAKMVIEKSFNDYSENMITKGDPMAKGHEKYFPSGEDFDHVIYVNQEIEENK